MNRGLRNLLAMTLAALVSAALFYVLREHWAHVFGVLPYLLFLVCPAMHYFMHGHHEHPTNR